jgi:hypothetical protein
MVNEQQKPFSEILYITESFGLQYRKEYNSHLYTCSAASSIQRQVISERGTLCGKGFKAEGG